MRNVDETTHFFFGSLNILRIRNIFVVLMPIAIRGGFDQKKLPPQCGSKWLEKCKIREQSKISSNCAFCLVHIR